MKNWYFFLLLLLPITTLQGQQLEYSKGKNRVTIESGDLFTLLKPYFDAGKQTEYVKKDAVKVKEELKKIKGKAISKEIEDKIKGVRGSIFLSMYFDKEGEIIFISISISNSMYEKLNDVDIRNIYNQIQKEKINMDLLRWEGNFNYGVMSVNLLKL